MEEGILLKIKRYWKPLVFIIIGLVLVVISMFLAERIVSKGYNIGDVLSDLDTDTEEISLETGDSPKPSRYYEVDSTAVVDTDGHTYIYNQDKDIWDSYDAGTHFSMKSKYYANNIENISGDTFEDTVLNRTMYLISSEVFFYSDDLDNAHYDVVLGKDSNGRDVAVVECTFDSGVIMKFSYNSIAVTPIEISKNREFYPVEVEALSWVLNPSVGVCREDYSDGMYILSVI